YRDVGDPARAAEVSPEACAQAEVLMGRDPTDFHLRSLSIRAQRLAAGDAEARGDLAAAARLRARSGELLSGIGAPAGPKLRRSVAQDAMAEGRRQLRWGHWRAGLESFRQALVCQWQANRPDHRPDQRASASRQ